MSALWTSAAMAGATGGRATRDFSIGGIAIDSRAVEPGDLFVALQAERDGHDFVANALKAGAGGALVSKRPEGVAGDAPLVIVDDTLKALERMGAARRAESRAKVISVTGSVGKTSTKEMLRLALAPFGTVHAAEKSFNNHWGVPLTLARMPVDADFAVIEIGMNHPGEIAPLARLAAADVAMITTVATAHLAAFEDLAGIAAEKAAVFEGLREGGAAVFHGDMPAEALAVVGLAAGKDAVRFGATAACDFTLLDARISDGQLLATAQTPGGVLAFTLATTSPHFATNAVGVLAVVAALGRDLGVAAAALGRWSPPPGRGTRHVIPCAGGTFTLIDDAYNANPASMAAALGALAAEAAAPQGARIAVLGEMLELGAREAAFHAALAEEDAMRHVARVFCVGPRMRALYEALPANKRGGFAETAADLDISNLAGPGDVVLVKGSNASGVAKVAEALKAPETV